MTVSKLHETNGTIGDIDPEIITIVAQQTKCEDYKLRRISQRDFWNSFAFFGTASISQFEKLRKLVGWPLLI
jgi:hypothetical protein